MEGATQNIKPDDTFGIILTIRAQNDSPRIYGVEFGTFYGYMNTLLQIAMLRATDTRHINEIYKDMYQYVFQLTYTMVVFWYNNIQHSDLHLNNILMDSYYPGESRIGVYRWRDRSGKEMKAYTNTQYIPRIFDFDRAKVTKRRQRFESYFLDYIQRGLSKTSKSIDKKLRGPLDDIYNWIEQCRGKDKSPFGILTKMSDKMPKRHELSGDDVKQFERSRFRGATIKNT
jgi:hypothetical protein